MTKVPRVDRHHMLGAFAAMLFVGVSWGANVPVSKVMLQHFDVVPMLTIRTLAAVATLGVLLVLAEGVRNLRIEIGLKRFLLIGLMMSGFFTIFLVGIRFSNPISAAAVRDRRRAARSTATTLASTFSPTANLSGRWSPRSRCVWSPARDSIRGSAWRWR